MHALTAAPGANLRPRLSTPAIPAAGFQGLLHKPSRHRKSHSWYRSHPSHHRDGPRPRPSGMELGEGS